MYCKFHHVTHVAVKHSSFLYEQQKLTIVVVKPERQVALNTANLLSPPFEMSFNP